MEVLNVEEFLIIKKTSFNLHSAPPILFFK